MIYHRSIELGLQYVADVVDLPGSGLILMWSDTRSSKRRTIMSRNICRQHRSQRFSKAGAIAYTVLLLAESDESELVERKFKRLKEPCARGDWGLYMAAMTIPGHLGSFNTPSRISRTTSPNINGVSGSPPGDIGLVVHRKLVKGFDSLLNRTYYPFIGGILPERIDVGGNISYQAGTIRWKSWVVQDSIVKKVPHGIQGLGRLSVWFTAV